MAMESVEPFLAGEEDDFGFELFPVEPEDPALSQWELVNPSDAESDLPDADTDLGSASANDESLSPLHDHTSQWMPPTAADGPPFPGRCLNGVGSHVPSVDQLMLAIAGYYERSRSQGYRHDADAGDFFEEDEDDVGEDDDGLDDELVPRHLSGKLGKQRMRKLGKRLCSRMNTSKRSPHLYVKPGCLYGKHGLGLKHSIC